MEHLLAKWFSILETAKNNGIPVQVSFGNANTVEKGSTYYNVDPFSELCIAMSGKKK